MAIVHLNEHRDVEETKQYVEDLGAHCLPRKVINSDIDKMQKPP